MKTCCNCGKANLIKYGFTTRKKSANSQKWRCKDCNTVIADELRIKRMTLEDKAMADKMISEGIAYRKIQRLLGFKALYTIIQRIIQSYIKKSQNNY